MPISVYRGENAVEHFLDAILKEKEIESRPKNLSTDEERLLQEVTHCLICKNSLNNNRFRDRCYLNGVYRGALLEKCNISYKQSKSIPIVFHRLKS